MYSPSMDPSRDPVQDKLERRSDKIRRKKEETKIKVCSALNTTAAPWTVDDQKVEFIRLSQPCPAGRAAEEMRSDTKKIFKPDCTPTCKGYQWASE